MMCKLDNLIKGIAAYIKEEIICKYPENSLARFGLGVYADSILGNPTTISNKIKCNPFLCAMVQEDEVDVETLQKAIKDNMPENGIAFTLPIGGTIKIDKIDIDLILKHIV